MIPRRNLSLLSNRLAQAGGRRLPESVLERDYCIAWFLVGLATSPLRDALVFKGGTALKRCYFGDYRFSEDTDFTSLPRREQESILGRIARDRRFRQLLTDAVGIRFLDHLIIGDTAHYSFRGEGGI
jgi:hypothetical protein